MIDNAIAGRTIARLRQEKGLSQQGLAALMNVTHQAVSKWENGAALPDMQTLLALAKLFHVSMEDILLGAEAPQAQAQAPEAPEQREEPEEVNAADLPEMSLEEVMGMVPFMSRSTIEALLTRCAEQMEWQHLTRIAPFVSGEFLARMIRDRKITDPSVVKKLAPFLPGNIVDEMVLGVWNKNAKPEARVEKRDAAGGASVLSRIAKKAVAENNIEWLRDHIDDLPKDDAREIVAQLMDDGRWELVGELCEELDESVLEEAALRAANAGKWAFVETAAEELDEKALHKLIDMALAQSNWDMINRLSELL